MVAPAIGNYNSGRACTPAVQARECSIPILRSREGVCALSIVNTAIRTAEASVRKLLRRSLYAETPRRETPPAETQIHLARARSRCPEHTPFLVVPSAALCSLKFQNPWDNAQSAASNSTPANSAVTSIPRAASNACSGFRKELLGKMYAMNAGSIRSVCEWRSRLLREWRLALTPPDGHSTICLRIRAGVATDLHGLLKGGLSTR
jgi:hypothetical protein